MSAPEPLVSAEVDLRGFPFVPLYIERLTKSKAWLVCKRRPELAFYMLNLWMRAWHETPAGSIEDDDDVLADAAMCELRRWGKLRADVLRNWTKCSDGRLYHPVVAELAKESYAGRVEHRETLANKKERQRRWRGRLRELSARLRAVGVTPPPGASMETLETLMRQSAETSVDERETSTRDAVDEMETGKKGTGTGRGTKKEEERIYAFQGRALRLTRADYDAWRKLYHAIPDLDAELGRIDLSLAAESHAKPFVAASAMLNAKHQKLLAAKTAHDAAHKRVGMGPG